MLKRLSALLLIMLSLASIYSPALFAQDYRFEAGAGIGMSGYLGDTNKSNVYKNPGFAGGFLFRYIMDYRWALKANLYTASISGNSSTGTDYFPDGYTYKFKSQLYDLGAQIEFNFFNFGIGYKYKRLHRVAPYLTVGVGATLGVCDGNSSVALSVPVGAGVKYKISERLNVGAEFTMRKVFGDKMDGFSLDDINGIKSSAIKNTDWFSLIMISVTYEFGKKCRVCHYKE